MTAASLPKPGRLQVSKLCSASVVADDKTSPDHGGGKRRAGYSISGFFRQLSPFPFAGVPVVAGDAALDLFVAPFVARHDEGREIAAAKAKRAERRHDDEL
jgi:hypothetical protein